jgi:hypothetical protein
MKTLFEEYLENIYSYAAEEAIKKKQKKKKSVLDLSKSQSFVASAHDGGPIDVLSRVFNEFPLVYAVPSNAADESKTMKIFSVVSAKTFTEWRADYENILNAGTFKLITMGNHASVITTPDSEKAAKAFAFKIIAQACRDLLDDKGKLKPSIIAAFYLDGILAKFRDNPEKLEEMTAYLLFGYCTQLIITGLYELICNRHPVSQVDFQCYGMQVKQGDYFNRFFRELFVMSDEHQALRFTPFFKNKILDCLAVQAIQSNELENLVTTLIKRQDATEITAELKEYSSTKEHRVALVNAIKTHLQQHYDVATQIQLLDKMLADANTHDTMGTLLSEPRFPMYDKAESIAKSLLSWLTSAPTEPKLTNSITELQKYRDALALQFAAQAQPSPRPI